uniref:60S ribosomal protein L27 n=1 Tax=Echinococcus granulosus TaxID=6210 RepID=A0A068X068_ECHGR|nr:60S ribosomal protein L27 [Echinococcus granulosus]
MVVCLSALIFCLSCHTSARFDSLCRVRLGKSFCFAINLRSNMRLMRPGMAVIVLSGKYAGRKAIIIKNYDDGSTQKPYGHALVVGIDRYPRRILRRMSKKRIEGRSKIKPFIKLINYNHIMPTRHTINIQFNTSVVNKNCLVDKPKKRTALLEAKMKLQERYG